MNLQAIHLGRCKCGGYGQCFDAQAEKKAGVCHRGIGGDLFGHFVTAKLKGKKDCRQGVVVSLDPLIIRGKCADYECDGVPTLVTDTVNTALREQGK